MKFAEAYARTLKPRQSAVDAGCAPRSASVTASKWLNLAKVQAAIREFARKEFIAAAAEFGTTPESLIRQIVETLQFDPVDLYDEDGNAKPLSKIPDHARRCINEVSVFAKYGKNKRKVEEIRKYKLVPRQSMMRMLGEYHKLFTGTGDLEKNVHLTVVTGVPARAGSHVRAGASTKDKD